MSDRWDQDDALDVERYELQEGPAYRFALDRREFLAALGGGLLVVAAAGPKTLAQGRRRGGGGTPQRIGAWLHIGEDGAVTVYTGKVEVGQNIRTELTQVVAEELRLPVERVTLVMGDTDRVPYDAGTFGSQTTPRMVPQLRRAAAAAREVLLGAAAEEWKVERAGLVCREGRVVDPAGSRSIGYGELTKGRQLVEEIEDDPPLTPPEQWTVAGKSVPKVTGRALVTGAHRYSSDVSLPGMMYGKVVRPPTLGAALVSVDLEPARSMPGVVAVQDGDFLGVAAPDPRTAERALEAVRAEWKPAPMPAQADLFRVLKETAPQDGGGDVQGSLEQGLAAADVKLRETYTVQYIAHAPLEPRAAVAEWKDGKLTVWTGTQRPFGVRDTLMETFRLPQEKVRVLMPDTGSGYGGKHTGECAVEAARLAKAAGRPVKLVWTREEEFTWAYFRPAGVIEVVSGAKRDGTLTAWEFHNYNSGGAGIRTFYDVPNQRIQFHRSDSPLRQGSYRALAATANHFARESHMDELANALKMDPLELRLRNLKTNQRLRAVFEAAAKSFGWDRTPPAGHAYGIAGGFEKGGNVASCVDVSVEEGAVRVHRVVTAFECGAVINPNHLRNQIEGCVVMGLGGALFEQIDFRDGRILNPRFSSYRVPRFSDTPVLECVLLDRKDIPSAGAGETPIVGVAPAIAQALFRITGKRIRSLPLAREGLS